MAIRRDVLMEVGPFDPALGAGTSTRGGEDLDMFARILATGDVIIHTPDASCTIVTASTRPAWISRSAATAPAWPLC